MMMMILMTTMIMIPRRGASDGVCVYAHECDGRDFCRDLLLLLLPGGRRRRVPVAKRPAFRQPRRSVYGPTGGEELSLRAVAGTVADEA